MTMRKVPPLALVSFLFAAAGGAEQAAPTAPSSVRASRNTYSAVMDVLSSSRPRVTDEQLARLKKVPIEAVWAAIQGKGYKQCFATDFRLTQPGRKMVGRALTMRYMPVRPDHVHGRRHRARDQVAGRGGSGDRRGTARPERVPPLEGLPRLLHGLPCF